MSPPITAHWVDRMRPLVVRPSASRKWTTRVSSPKIVFQASVRTMKVMKKGTITRPSIRFFHLPALKAIT